MPNIGPMELIIVLVIVLLIFGPKRLPGLGRQLGSGMREFKDSITSKSRDDDDHVADAPRLERTSSEEEHVTEPVATAAPTRAEEPAVRRDA